jgi:hypothetical protein
MHIYHRIADPSVMLQIYENTLRVLVNRKRTVWLLGGIDCIDSSEVDFLAQIVEVLQNSTIVGERGQDALSKFWAAYKKVSSEYDSDMLERCNGNMDIVLIFVSEYFF